MNCVIISLRLVINVMNLLTIYCVSDIIIMYDNTRTARVKEVDPVSWSNPSQQEAQEAYDAAKQKYDTSAEEYLRLSKLKEQYSSDASSSYNSYAADDMALTRLRQLEFKLQRVQRFFGEGESGIDYSVMLSRISAAQAANDFTACVSCDGATQPPFGRAFTSPYIQNDTDTSRAKQLVEAELARVRERITELSNRAKASAEAYNRMKSMAGSIDDEMAELKKTMDGCAFDMEHYKKYI